jgi:hypothetical protein
MSKYRKVKSWKIVSSAARTGDENPALPGCIDEDEQWMVCHEEASPLAEKLLETSK